MARTTSAGDLVPGRLGEGDLAGSIVDVRLDGWSSNLVG